MAMSNHKFPEVAVNLMKRKYWNVWLDESKALDEFVAGGYVELLRLASGEEAALLECMYRKVPPVDQLSPEAVVTQKKKRGKYLNAPERADRAFAPEKELNIFKNCKSDVRLQSTLENKLNFFFALFFSEWNPYYADDDMG